MPNWKISLSLFSLITGVFISASALSQPIVPKIFLLTASANLNGQNGKDGQNGLPGSDCDANGGNDGNCSGTVTDHHHKHSDNTNGDNNKQVTGI